MDSEITDGFGNNRWIQKELMDSEITDGFRK